MSFSNPFSFQGRISRGSFWAVLVSLFVSLFGGEGWSPVDRRWVRSRSDMESGRQRAHIHGQQAGRGLRPVPGAGRRKRSNHPSVCSSVMAVRSAWADQTEATS